MKLGVFFRMALQTRYRERWYVRNKFQIVIITTRYYLKTFDYFVSS